MAPRRKITARKSTAVPTQGRISKLEIKTRIATPETSDEDGAVSITRNSRAASARHAQSSSSRTNDNDSDAGEVPITIKLPNYAAILSVLNQTLVMLRNLELRITRRLDKMNDKLENLWPQSNWSNQPDWVEENWGKSSPAPPPTSIKLETESDE